VHQASSAGGFIPSADRLAWCAWRAPAGLARLTSCACLCGPRCGRHSIRQRARRQARTARPPPHAPPPQPPPPPPPPLPPDPALDFLGPGFDALRALRTPGLVPPDARAPPLDNVTKCRRLLPTELPESAAACAARRAQAAPPSEVSPSPCHPGMHRPAAQLCGSMAAGLRCSFYQLQDSCSARIAARGGPACSTAPGWLRPRRCCHCGSAPGCAMPYQAGCAMPDQAGCTGHAGESGARAAAGRGRAGGGGPGRGRARRGHRRGDRPGAHRRARRRGWAAGAAGALPGCAWPRACCHAARARRARRRHRCAPHPFLV